LKSKRKSILLILLSLVLAAGAGAIWYILSGASPGSAPSRSAKQPKPLLVEVKPVRRGEIAQVLELSGEIVAIESVVIAATKEGPIKYCPWREGDSVRTGDRLVEIDRAVHRAEVRAAQAALAVARSKLADLKAGARPEEIDKAKANVKRWQATLEEASKSHKRQSQLIAQDFTSQQSVDQARERMKVAEAELAASRETLRMLQAGPTPTEIAVQSATVEEAAARLALAKAHLAECVIAAPFDGTITKVHVRAGDLASAKAPLLEMFAPSSLVVRFAVPEAHAAPVQPGLGLRVTLDAIPGQEFSAEVVRVYPQLDATTRTRTVEARLTGSAALAPNMFARLTLDLRKAGNALLVPAEAVLTTPGGGHVVFVVDQGKARRRRVELGIRQERVVQAVKGVGPGDRVVVAGQAGLRDGQAVRIAGQAGRGGGQPATGQRRPSTQPAPNRGAGG